VNASVNPAVTAAARKKKDDTFMTVDFKKRDSRKEE
jgi:hypothetical protein